MNKVEYEIELIPIGKKMYMSLEDVKTETWEKTYDLIYQIIRGEFERHKKLLQSEKIISYQKEYMEKMLNGNASVVDVSCAFLNLSHMASIIYLLKKFKNPDLNSLVIFD